ncbi:MAG TPA: hypothetical protein VND96_14010 [Candidatus Micrarchaeaceae archaeon]|nr:hypothetical protein [Candidatus Micrarchaeaceae archaeon]
MNNIEQLEKALLGIAGVLVVMAAALAWIAVAEHPTAGNIKRAVFLTLKG